MHNILIIDDDRMNQLLAKKFLSEYYTVEGVASGGAALEYLEASKPDLILLDLVMPEMDGFEVLERIRKNPKTASIPVIFLTADRSEKVEEACFKAGCADFISKPFLPAVMVQRVRRTLELEDYRRHMEACVSEHVDRLTRSQDSMIITLASLIDRRDGTTGGHIWRSSRYIRLLVKKLQEQNYYPEELTQEHCDIIMRAAPLYDLGKITVPDSILQKPGKLTPEEYEIAKSHTTAGGEIIRKSMSGAVDDRFVDIAADMATSHHERWDGSGYPCGLRGKEIPLGARIAAVADVFDALVSKTYYSQSLSPEEAIRIMLGEREKYDPQILDVFFRCREELPQTIRRENSCMEE